MSSAAHHTHGGSLPATTLSADVSPSTGHLYPAVNTWLTPDGKHRLSDAFNFWFFNRRAQVPAASSAAVASTAAPKDQYEGGLFKVGPFSTVEDFWVHYSHARRPTETSQLYILHYCFRDGVEPLWEHPANARGGRWIVRLRKGTAGRAWESALLALVGDEFNLGDEVCGVVLSIKKHTDATLSFWVRATTKEAGLRVRDAIKRMLGVGSNALEYRMHDTSLQRHEATVASKEQAAAAAQQKTQTQAQSQDGSADNVDGSGADADADADADDASDRNNNGGGVMSMMKQNNGTSNADDDAEDE